jgi:hypothetical protein
MGLVGAGEETMQAWLVFEGVKYAASASFDGHVDQTQTCVESNLPM